MFETSEVTRAAQAAWTRLSSGSSSELAAVSSGEWVALVAECQTVANVAGAVQTLAMAHLAALEDVALQDGAVVEQHRGIGHTRLDAPALVSEPLGLTDQGASARVRTAVALVERLPGVVAAMGEGRLDAFRAGIVADELEDAPPEVCNVVVERIADRLGTEPGGALRRRVRRVLGAVDAELVRVRAERQRKDRSLCRWAEGYGTDTWVGRFPVEVAREAWTVVDELAKTLTRDGRCQTIEQARADAMMQLILSRGQASYQLQVAVPESVMQAGITPSEVLEALGLGSAQRQDPAVDESLVEVTGLGSTGTTLVRRSWLIDVAGKATSTHVVACDHASGAMVSASRRSGAGWRAGEVTSYTPPAWMRELVQARDGRCRFPGCTVSARFCDLDHVRPWPVGPTGPANLACLCRRHHRVKQRPRWRVRMLPGARLKWTDPTGRVRTTHPIDHLGVTQSPLSDVFTLPAAYAGSLGSATPSPDVRAAEPPASWFEKACREQLSFSWKLIRRGRIPERSQIDILPAKYQVEYALTAPIPVMEDDPPPF